MTEFIYTLTDERVTTKNNTNNVQKGDHIRIESDDMPCDIRQSPNLVIYIFLMVVT